MKNDEVSCIHSLASPFEYNPLTVGDFERLGYGPQGDYHVAVFFRNIVHSILRVNVTSPLLTTKRAAVYELVGAKGSVYGILLVMDKDAFTIQHTHMVVEGDSPSVGDFSMFPISTDRYSVQLYMDSVDTLLVNRGTLKSNLVVVDE